ncbi:MAG: hypothetical protein CSYNP_00899 [Syntrophus sp. SKADARSKE-3]|nr:hypothetical protein [Syntrophus sp. SKADARSKE-3]
MFRKPEGIGTCPRKSTRLSAQSSRWAFFSSLIIDDCKGQVFKVTLSSLIKKTRIGPGQAYQPWFVELGNTSDTLHKLASSTEIEFLELGERLQEYHKRSREISELSSQVSERLSGDEMNRGIEGLRNILEQVKSRTDQSASGAHLLSGIIGQFYEIRLHLGYFDRTIKNLQALCNMIRIESARLGSEENNFTTLSDDIRKLASLMENKSKELTNRLDKLTILIRQHMKRINEFEEKEKGQANLILDNTTMNLDAITDRRNLSAMAISNISNQWIEISKSIGEVVSSLQFHDITRQRIEHVCEGLRDITKLKDRQIKGNGDTAKASWLLWKGIGNIRPAFANRRTRAAMALAPCELQIAQLKNAEKDLVAAVDRIRENLSRIASDMVKMSEDTMKAAGADEGQDRSFFSELKNGLSVLTESIGAYTDIRTEWTASMHQFKATIGDMSSFIREIIGIGINMRLIALNACIHAARIGDKGLALGVLAESIHQLSTYTSQNITTMSDQLSTIVGETTKLAEQEGSGSLVQQDSTSMEARIAAIMAPLHRMDEKQAKLLTQIDDNSRTISQDMEETVSRLAAHEGLEKGIHNIAATLEALTRKIRAEAPVAALNMGVTDLSETRERYTMDKERQVHAALTSTAAQSIPPIVAVATKPSSGFSTVANMPSREESSQSQPVQNQQDDDLGDNVELF